MTQNKTNYLNTTPKKGAKSAYRYSDEFLNLHTLKKQPVSVEWLEHLAKELVNWALNDENALILTSFYTRKGICSRTVTRWRKRCKTFDYAHEFAKGAIGDRREIGALTKKFDAGMVIRSMAMYDEEWKKLEEWRSSLKSKEQEQKKPTTFKIIMPSFTTDTVKKRKEDTQTQFDSARQHPNDSELSAN